MARRKRGKSIPVFEAGIDYSEQGVKPTPETVRKHNITSFAKMCDAGEITGDMYRAAEEINAVHEALCRGLFAKSSSNFERVDGAKRSEMSDSIAYAHKERYAPWQNRLSARAKQGHPNGLKAVYCVVIDEWNVSTVDTYMGIGHGMAKFLVRRALLEYAVMARWCKGDELVRLDLRHQDFAKRAA